MVTIKLTNTKTRRKEVFSPIDPKNVRMYVCGPTVYDRAHIGNARPVVVFDVLYRLLRHVYGADHVTYVRNFTDVDDKINAEALRRQKAGATGTMEDLIHQRTEETIGWYYADMDALGALRPSIKGVETDRAAPRATEYIKPMVAMIEDLIAKGHAYAAEGHVLFRVRSYEKYGALSGRSIDDMIAGARVEVAPYKEDPMDFVLWKPSNDQEPGWDSPWGRGRPGWHIECSAMAQELFGESFDIHAGGIDLQFPHHENEIAQSACAHPHAEFARVWLHNEMLQVEGKKMSKSLGNFFTVRDLLDQGVPGEVIRFVLLGTHYSKPMDWTAEKARQAEATLRKWRDMTGVGMQAISSEVPRRIIETLADDLNTSQAISELRELARDGRIAELYSGARLLGLLQPEHGQWHKEPEVPEVLARRITGLISRRNHAKNEKNYSFADAVRNGLEKYGVALFDNREGTNWHFDHFEGAKPLHEKLVDLLNSGLIEEFNQLLEVLTADGFSVSVHDVEGAASDRIVFTVGRSPGERARVLWQLQKGLQELESLK